LTFSLFVCSLVPFFPHGPLTTNNQTKQTNTAKQSQDLKAAAKTREDLGVQLYSQQQLLAKLQLTVERLQDGLVDANATRQQHEEQLTKLQQVTVQQESSTTQLAKAADNVRDEMDDLKQKVATLQRHKEELEAKLQVTQRAAGKAAQEQEKKSVEKQRQVRDGFF
jgi:chromosome segregation ATPase